MKRSSINGVLRIKRKLFALLLLVANSAALAQPPSVTTDDPLCPATFPTSPQWRKEMMSGKKLAAEMEQHVTLIKDPYITSYLNRLEQNIVRNSGLHLCFVVKVVKDVEVNAYSLPGGFLYVTSGLILTVTNEAGLVGALAHETGHVSARHLTKIVKQKKTLALSVAARRSAGIFAWPKDRPVIHPESAARRRIRSRSIGPSVSI